MCDDYTAEAEEEALRKRGLSRREFTALGAAAALAGCAGANGTAADGGELVERTVQVTTSDGVADAFFVHPAQGAHPGVILWPDIAGLRDVFKIMARRLASQGYAVLAVNQYYRNAPAPVLGAFSEWRTPEGREKIAPMREAITPSATTRDAKAFVAYLDQQQSVDKARGIGSNGYCMGGPFTVRTAAAAPGRVRAAASFHGAGLVAEGDDSPHELLDDTQAAYLFAIARNDDEKSPDHKTILRQAADAAGVPAEIEVYPADHGWCVADSPAYDATQAERAWSAMMRLFDGL
ncbi:hydrolase [Novosphingobium marinum]|uniref:Carboxymethylenebutenolidase n=1 Tax=Novosphingobium marinum TaxID=1514948 RepID=A0A7Y9XY05_9SPHN|nr:dienelactone hydrolase family protein [Novosphingobium marinum]NYH95101.1 carboxymethylenebutenolidase [Novosphingobium marinum]GGC24277.1 hydrolase [Novosphingobium marinum]